MTTAPTPPTALRRAPPTLRRTSSTVMRTLRPRALALCLLAALPAFAARARSQTPSEEVVDSARTPAGELTVVRRREPDEVVTIVIKLGGRVLAEKGDGYRSASIRGTYPARSPRYALVGLSTDGLVCGVKFTVVDLSSARAAKATRDFGNCSDAPRVSYRRGALLITFPAGPRRHDPGTHYVGPGQVWSYSGGRLRRLGR